MSKLLSQYRLHWSLVAGGRPAARVLCIFLQTCLSALAVLPTTIPGAGGFAPLLGLSVFFHGIGMLLVVPLYGRMPSHLPIMTTVRVTAALLVGITVPTGLAIASILYGTGLAAAGFGVATATVAAASMLAVFHVVGRYAAPRLDPALKVVGVLMAVAIVVTPLFGYWQASATLAAFLLMALLPSRVPAASHMSATTEVAPAREPLTASERFPAELVRELLWHSGRVAAGMIAVVLVYRLLEAITGLGEGAFVVAFCLVLSVGGAIAARFGPNVLSPRARVAVYSSLPIPARHVALAELARSLAFIATVIATVALLGFGWAGVEAALVLPLVAAFTYHALYASGRAALFLVAGVVNAGAHIFGRVGGVPSLAEVTLVLACGLFAVVVLDLWTWRSIQPDSHDPAPFEGLRRRVAEMRRAAASRATT